MITLLTILTTVACTIFAGGIYILCRYSERNLSQRVLMGTLAVWLVIVGQVVGIVAFTDAYSSFQMSLFDVRVLVRALVGYFALILYLVVSVDAKLFNAKVVSRLSLPAIGVIALYFCWHAVSGEPYDIVYSTYDELWCNITSATVILRLVITLTIVVYMCFASWFIWTLIPIYQRYVWDNYADSRYNLLWIKKSTISLIFMSLAYLVNLITHCNYSLAGYVFIGIFAFILIIDNAMDRKLFTSPDKLNIVWDGWRGWRILVLPEVEIEDDDQELISVSFDEFQRWISESKPYYAADFTFQSVAEHFTCRQSQLILRGIHLKGYNFQTYIRKCRIEEAVTLMNDDHMLSIKQVSSIVGFSHDSSFSRAFNAVMGITPTEFKSRYSE